MFIIKKFQNSGCFDLAFIAEKFQYVVLKSEFIKGGRLISVGLFFLEILLRPGTIGFVEQLLITWDLSSEMIAAPLPIILKQTIHLDLRDAVVLKTLCKYKF